MYFDIYFEHMNKICCNIMNKYNENEIIAHEYVFYGKNTTK